MVYYARDVCVLDGHGAAVLHNLAWPRLLCAECCKSHLCFAFCGCGRAQIEQVLFCLQEVVPCNMKYLLVVCSGNVYKIKYILVISKK
jgi:elongation factor P hydroxylase